LKTQSGRGLGLGMGLKLELVLMMFLSALVFQFLSPRVAVLHPLPPGTAVSATKTLGSPGDGPRFDRTGTFIPHSVLGPSEDYTSTLRSKGMVGGSMSAVCCVVPGY